MALSQAQHQLQKCYLTHLKVLYYTSYYILYIAGNIFKINIFVVDYFKSFRVLILEDDIDDQYRVRPASIICNIFWRFKVDPDNREMLILSKMSCNIDLHNL